MQILPRYSVWELYVFTMRNTFLLFFLLISAICFPQGNSTLWYTQPASEWMQATPLGNGRLGIMVFGGTEKETVSLNEITMWSGQVDKFQELPCGKERLHDIRQLFFDGNYAEGNRIATESLAGTPHSFGSHVPLGDLNIAFDHAGNSVSDYKRTLNLANAVNEVTYKVGNVRYKREYICSNPDDALIIKLSADKKGMLNCSISLALFRESVISSVDKGIEFSGKASFPRQGPGGVNFSGKVGVSVDNGSISTENGMIRLNKATNAVIVFDVRTDYKDKQYKENCAKTVKNVLVQPYNVLKDRHVKDYKALYDRADLYFGESGSEHLPTDIRRDQLKTGKNDIGLDALFFRYSRYLLIAASRENSPLPANLQGIWNDNLACNCGWTNDYHLDINTQQNYWMANTANLHECNRPLFDYIKDLSVWGQKTAREVYGARGWTAHTVANVWGYTASGSGVNWGLFPTGSSWIASHLWTHYRYTSDKDFLKNEAYPILKSNAEFLLDYMVVNPNNGYLMTGPSTSPENSFKYKNDVLALSMMPACDRQLAYEIFTSCIEASKILNIDNAFRNTLKTAVSKLPPIMIGKNGAVQEWFEDFEEASPNHRHTSHLLALYPFDQITPDKTPELAKAAEKTIEYRLAAEGWEDVEWSRANLICNYARLKDPKKAYESVTMLQHLFSRENLLTISPEGIGGAPSDIFVFDGNEAGGAGMIEMLLQSHEEYIEFLPALPKEWNTGHFSGLCVRGGAEVDLNWKNGNPEKARIKATADNTFRIKLPVGAIAPRCEHNGRTIDRAQIKNGMIELNLKKGDIANIKFN